MESTSGTAAAAKVGEDRPGQISKQSRDTAKLPGSAKLTDSAKLTVAELTVTIERRIHRQTASRILDLAVEVGRSSIVLRGRCLTYYTKQLAGHAAMGVLEGETLSNQIEVALP